MEAGGAGTAMEVLVQTLINLFEKEIYLIRGLDEEVRKLKMSLGTIRGYLNDAEKKYITQDAVKAWLQELEAVAFDAYDVLDELDYHALHMKVKATKTMVNNALSCFSSFDHTLRPLHMAHRIEDFNASFNSITERATHLHLESALVDAFAVPDVSFETNSYTLDPIFVGRDDDVPMLVNEMNRSLEERMITILAVVGMGGMGKTTLTRKVFNNERLKTQFGCHSWVYVSKSFDPLIIFKKFLATLPSQSDEDKSKEEHVNEPLKPQKSFKVKTDEVETSEGILKKLKEALKARTYLLVLDDVWNEDILKWADFINSLSRITSTNGNGIIITTRSTHVASIMSPFKTHILNGISEEDCWSIIKSKAFDMDNEIPSEFVTTGRKIARRCHGLPLAATVVAGVLRGTSKQEWPSIEQKWVEGDDISRILRLSYDNLPSASLKKCFAYCSIFPKGYRMVKQKLIELWMAEGFLQPDERNDMESVGEKFVNVLLHNSLLQLASRSDDEDKDREIYVMHDLVHDLASSVFGSDKVRYLMHGDESSHIPKESAKYLRTLFLKGKISEFKLSDFNCLHVLSFGTGSDGVRKLQSSSIRKLIHLRKLDISNTRIRYLPNSIGELHHLQTLRAETFYLEKLPSTLKYLISLRNLYAPYDVNIPPMIGRLTSLRTLTHFTVGYENGCKIEEIGCLKNLKGKLTIHNLEKVQGKEEAEKANLFHNPNLLHLRFEWSYWREEGEMNHENVLEGLQPHSNLKKLEIVSFRGKRFPLWTLKMAGRHEPWSSWVMLKNLVEIRLVRCNECEELPTLGNLPNLKHLYLRELRNVKSIQSSLYEIGVGQEATDVFPMLERLELDSMDELREWTEAQFHETPPHGVKVFPRVEYLKIFGCKKLMITPIHSFTSLKELDLRSLDGLLCLPDRLFDKNHNLSKLIIRYCPKLRELPNGLNTLNSLEELEIVSCQNLKSMGNPSGESQGPLRVLEIKDCKELLSLPQEMVQSWAASLKIVTLRRLSSLKNLPEVIECLAKLARLRELWIEGVPNFMDARGFESWHSGILQSSVIRGSVDWSNENSVAIRQNVDAILQRCAHSLVELSLQGLENWECVPESIQLLTGIRRLVLHDFGIEELPQWFGNLSSVEKIILSDCAKLRRVDALGSLTKLQELWIDGCSKELRIDSKWLSNFSIRLNGRWIRSVR